MKAIIRFVLTVWIVSFISGSAISKEKNDILTAIPSIIAASKKCEYTPVGTWLSTNRNPSDYEMYITFAANGQISEIGAFNVAPSPGSYQLGKNCAISCTITEADSNVLTLTGEIVSDNSMYLSVDGGGDPIDFVKVTDIGACQGTWNGALNNINPPPPPSATIQFVVAANGAITSFSGLAAPVTGKIYCVSGQSVAHMKTGESSDFREILLDGTMTGNNVSGQYGIDNSSGNDPDGTFSISRQ